jgi:hypothetical protein
MNRQQLRTLTMTALVSVVLLLLAHESFAGSTYRSPPAVSAGTRPGAYTTRQTSYYIPTGAPVHRTFTWYAPPPGYQVILEGTPAEPRQVTVVGPDGISRSVRLEGPVIMRVHHYAVLQNSR